jgi:hypothetical protein
MSEMSSLFPMSSVRPTTIVAGLMGRRVFVALSVVVRPRKLAARSARASALRSVSVRRTGASLGSGSQSWSNASPTTVAWSVVRQPESTASPNRVEMNDREPAVRGALGSLKCSSASDAKWRQPWV